MTRVPDIPDQHAENVKNQVTFAVFELVVAAFR
jgi:hypothetical protein